MKGRVWSVLAVFTFVAMAGCADEPSQTSEEDEVYSSLELEEVSDKGIIKGVVIDDAIRPLMGATILLAGPEGEESVTSNEKGAFGFDELPPGDYFLTISKNGYNTVQQSTPVKAGANPDSLKVMLTADPTALAFVDEIIERGYVECSTPFVAVCYGVELLAPDLVQEKSQFHYPVTTTPDHIQTEMVWQNSQALNGEFSLLYSYGDCGSGFYCDKSATGPSPLMNSVTGDQVEEVTTVDGERELYARIFSAGLAETDHLVGLSIQQDFELVTHFFYNFVPPEDWRFTEAGEAPKPPE